MATLCVLVADMDGDGFDPPLLEWAEDDDILVTVSDAEFPAGSGGTKYFDLADGITEAGLLSRSLTVDLAQFEGRSTPVPLALRWFPGYQLDGRASAPTRPEPGSAYGEFSRAVARYSHTGSVGWFISMEPGLNVTLDPLATAGLGGEDSALAATAFLVTSAPRGLIATGSGVGAVTLQFKGGAGLVYHIERGTDLEEWTALWNVGTSSTGDGLFTDTAASAERAFYRVRGPFPE